MDYVHKSSWWRINTSMHIQLKETFTLNVTNYPTSSRRNTHYTTLLPIFIDAIDIRVTRHALDLNTNNDTQLGLNIVLFYIKVAWFREFKIIFSGIPLLSGQCNSTLSNIKVDSLSSDFSSNKIRERALDFKVPYYDVKEKSEVGELIFPVISLKSVKYFSLLLFH